MSSQEAHMGRPGDPEAIQAAFDMGTGWVTRFVIDGRPYGGAKELTDDRRIHWFAEQIGGFAGRTVLELGPLEGAHSAMLERMGASQITAIEGLRRAFLKCLIVKEVLGLRHVRFLHADFARWVAGTDVPYDVVLACGVLYHQANPAQVIHDLGHVADAVCVWTQAADGENPPGTEVRVDAQGKAYVGRIKEYKDARVNLPHYCGGLRDHAVWLFPEEYRRCFYDAGFAHLVEADAPRNQNGAVAMFVASKQPLRSSGL